MSDDEYEKESVADFALWKARVPEDGEVYWPSRRVKDDRLAHRVQRMSMKYSAPASISISAAKT